MKSVEIVVTRVRQKVGDKVVILTFKAIDSYMEDLIAAELSMYSGIGR